MIDLSLVKDTTSTTGTGPIRLDNKPAASFVSLVAALPPGTTGLRYRIDDLVNGVFEEGIGTLVSPNTLARNKVLGSSAGRTALVLAAGSKQVTVKQLLSAPPTSSFRAKVEDVVAFPYYVVESDLGKIKRLVSATAAQVIFPEALLGFNVGFTQGGPGACTFSGLAPVTALNRQNFLTTAGVGAACTAVVDVDGVVTLAGDLVA